MRSQAVASCLLGFSLCVAFPESPGVTDQVAVQAEFLKHTDVRKLAAGSTVFAQVTADWNGADCVLRQGAILEATVEAAEVRKGRDKSTLALSFNRAQCNGGDMRTFKLVLVSVADAPVDLNITPNVQFYSPGNVSLGAGTRFAIEKDPGATWYTPRIQLAGVAHRFPIKANLHPGDVVGISGLKLDVGGGPNRSSVLSFAHGDVYLSAFTQILLIPESVAFVSVWRPVAAPRPAATANSVATKPADLPADTLEACAPPGCTVDLPITAKELEGRTPAAIAVRPLGYRPRTRRVLEDFDEEQRLAWLGANQLLFAFNSHALIARAKFGKGTRRIVRAVLIDAASRTVLRAVDWEIHDTGQFLWPLDANRILVHVGDELRVYGPGLEVERITPLTGPLAFLRIAPNGELIALATVHERHSPELHASLREELGEEPEEDVDIAVLDKVFDTIASATTVSRLMPPTLLNEGQVKLLAEPKMTYRLAMSTWQNTSATLARFKSLCTPQLSSVAPDLLFLVSCENRTGVTEYRMVRADGKLLLRGVRARSMSDSKRPATLVHLPSSS